MYARALTWWTFFRVSIEERLVYRGDFALATLMRFLPLITQVFLFAAIYETVADDSIGGFSFRNIVAYLLLVYVSRAFSSMPGLTTGIGNQVRSGEIKKFLIQPVDLIGFLLIQRIAHKLVYYLIAVIPFTLVFFFCQDFFPSGWPPPDVIAVFIVTLILGFLLGFFLEASLGLVSFWFLEVASLTFIYMLLSFILSGQMFPIDWFPTEPVNLRGAVELLPFKYLAYFPAAVFLQKVEGRAMYQGLAIEAAWVLFFFLLARILWWRGVKRYSGFGG